MTAASRPARCSREVPGCYIAGFLTGVRTATCTHFRSPERACCPATQRGHPVRSRSFSASIWHWACASTRPGMTGSSVSLRFADGSSNRTVTPAVLGEVGQPAVSSRCERRGSGAGGGRRNWPGGCFRPVAFGRRTGCRFRHWSPWSRRGYCCRHTPGRGTRGASVRCATRHHRPASRIPETNKLHVLRLISVTREMAGSPCHPQSPGAGPTWIAAATGPARS